MKKEEILGYDFIYHYNPYSKKWICAERKNYAKIFNGGWVATDKRTEAAEIEDAMKLMIDAVNGEFMLNLA